MGKTEAKEANREYKPFIIPKQLPHPEEERVPNLVDSTIFVHEIGERGLGALSKAVPENSVESVFAAIDSAQPGSKCDNFKKFTDWYLESVSKDLCQCSSLAILYCSRAIFPHIFKSSRVKYSAQYAVTCVHA